MGRGGQTNMGTRGSGNSGCQFQGDAGLGFSGMRQDFPKFKILPGGCERTLGMKFAGGTTHRIRPSSEFVSVLGIIQCRPSIAAKPVNQCCCRTATVGRESDHIVGEPSPLSEYGVYV